MPGIGDREIVREVVEFRGHPMVRASHPTTIELTTDGYLTEEGDCIIGVSASHGCMQLSEGLKQALRRENAKVTFKIIAGEFSFELSASGDPRLVLADPHEIVIRKSDFVNDRTLAIRADRAARGIPRSLVRQLKDPRTLGRLEIEVT
jgi:uncharacterized protein